MPPRNPASVLTEGKQMQRIALEDFLRTCDLDDKGVDAMTKDDAGQVRFLCELFHCDDTDLHRMGSRARNDYSWTSLSLHGGPVWVEETVSDRWR